jgi:hypothetical protein
VFLGNGDGSFGTGQIYDAGTSAYYVATGDFNNDGYPDIVVSGNTSGTVTILLNNADWTAPSNGFKDYHSGVTSVSTSTSTSTSGTSDHSASSQALDAVFGTVAKDAPANPLSPIHKVAADGNWLNSAAADLLQ